MSLKAQPREVINRLFAKLTALYGARFTRMWEDVDPESMIGTWSWELAGLTMQEIERGLARCGEHPPTVRAFRALCRTQQADEEAAFYEAAQRWPAREGWSSPAVYWAALAVGDDVKKQPYNEIKGRWRLAYSHAIAAAQPLPPAQAAPAVSDQRYTEEQRLGAAARVLAWCRANLRGMRGST